MIAPSTAFRSLLISFFIIPATIGLSRSTTAGAKGTVSIDPSGRFVTLADGQSNLVLRLNLEQGCKLDHVRVRGREVLSAVSGVYSGIKVSNQWFSTAILVSPPELKTSHQGVTVSGIRNGGNGVKVAETWDFTVEADRIEWRIKRRYLPGGRLEDSALPMWEFAEMSTWTGGMLDNGGVAWNRYLESPNATLGMHARAVTFWNKDSADALRISVNAGNAQNAVRFSHQPAGTELAVFSVTDDELVPKHDLRRYLAGAQDLWAPFTAGSTETTVTYTLQALDYDRAYDRGRFVGL